MRSKSFSSMLTTIALYDSSLRWFEARSCKLASRGLSLIRSAGPNPRSSPAPAQPRGRFSPSAPHLSCVSSSSSSSAPSIRRSGHVPTCPLVPKSGSISAPRPPPIFHHLDGRDQPNVCSASLLQLTRYKYFPTLVALKEFGRSLASSPASPADFSRDFHWFHTQLLLIGRKAAPRSYGAKRRSALVTGSTNCLFSNAVGLRRLSRSTQGIIMAYSTWGAADCDRPYWREGHSIGLSGEAEADVVALRVFSRAHRPKLHSTNPIERVSKEVKRRPDVVGIFLTMRRSGASSARSCSSTATSGNCNVAT